MNIGHSIRLEPREVEQAVKEHVKRLAAARGIQLPADTLDFHNRSTVHFLATDNSPVVFASVVVALEE